MRETKDKSKEPTRYNPSKYEALNEMNAMRPAAGCLVKVEPDEHTAPDALYQWTAEG